jgi:hypothetical protein
MRPPLQPSRNLLSLRDGHEYHGDLVTALWKAKGKKKIWGEEEAREE